MVPVAHPSPVGAIQQMAVVKILDQLTQTFQMHTLFQQQPQQLLQQHLHQARVFNIQPC